VRFEQAKRASALWLQLAAFDRQAARYGHSSPPPPIGEPAKVADPIGIIVNMHNVMTQIERETGLNMGDALALRRRPPPPRQLKTWPDDARS